MTIIDFHASKIINITITIAMGKKMFDLEISKIFRGKGVDNIFRQYFIK